MIKSKGISVRKRVQGGRPCIAGTRVMTEGVYVLFRDGFSVAKLRRFFVRQLTSMQIEDAIRFELRNRFRIVPTTEKESNGRG